MSGQTIPDHLADLVEDVSGKLGCAESQVWAFIAQHAAGEHAAAIERERATP